MSWTVDFVKTWAPQMSLTSVLRYRGVVMRQDKPNTGALIPLRLKQPFPATIVLREATSDFWTWREVLMDQVYASSIEHVPNCRTVVDLGANIGLASLYFSNAYRRAKIFCVEADESNFSVLRQNLKPLIEAKRCATFCAAVWSRDGFVSLTSSVPNKHDLNRYGGGGQGSSQRVAAASMQTVLARSGFDEVDLLKIDIEGGETALFAGDLSWLPRVRAIAIEFHDGSRSETRFDELMRGRKIIDTGHTVLAVAPRGPRA